MSGRGKPNGRGRGWEVEKSSGRTRGWETSSNTGARGGKTKVDTKKNDTWPRGRNHHSGGRGGAATQEGAQHHGQHHSSDSAQSVRKYQEACAEIQASVTKYLTEHPVDEDGSSEEEEVSTDLQDGLLSRVLAGASEGEAAATLTHLKDALSTGALTCLICIHAVRRTDQTWSCSLCYSVLHLDCVRKWADDSIFLRAEQERQHHSDQRRIDHTTLNWSCPKCRQQYGQKDIPRHYVCYCGKTYDPPLDPWILPHSCGETCGKALQPQCGHNCLMLCHPGVCSATCTYLSRCEKTCHLGECPPCPRTSVQRCLCRASKQQRPCNDPAWTCDK
ncbi:Zinc finger PHD-type conserved site, partial [Trinorchestia longiramus]